MDNGFRKFKRKILASAIIRAVLGGLSLGVIVAAVQWFLAKLTAGQVDLMKYGITGGIAALVSMAVMLAFWIPTDKRLAKRLDKKLGLNEKVQTMIAFRNDESEMAQLQRTDTQRILMETPGKKARSKHAWLVAILPVVACACMAVTILIPAKAAEGPKIQDSGWVLSVYDEQKLKDLIEYVRTSNMQNDPKQGIVTELEGLLEELRAVGKTSEMQGSVVEAINEIHKIASVCDTYSKITNAMRNTPSETVKQLGAHIASLDQKIIEDHLAELAASLNVDNKAESASVMAAGIQQALQNSKEDPENALYKALDTLAKDLEGVTNSTTEKQLKDIFDKAEDAIAKAVEQPGIDFGVEKYTITRLMAIFGIPSSSVPADVLKKFEDSVTGKPYDPEEEEEEKSNWGGLGEGELVFGSDDTIYDPELEKFVPYGEVLKKYQAIITEYITEGSLTPEQEEMINDYFAILFRKTEKEN